MSWTKGKKRDLAFKMKMSVIARNRVVSEETKEKMRKIAKERGFGKWMTGRKLSIEQRLKLSKIHKARYNFRIPQQPRDSIQLRLWREAVFKRDNWTCQGCGRHGGNLEANHVMPYAFFPEVRLELLNGETLCKPCHYKTRLHPKNMKRVWMVEESMVKCKGEKARKHPRKESVEGI